MRPCNRCKAAGSLTGPRETPFEVRLELFERRARRLPVKAYAHAVASRCGRGRWVIQTAIIWGSFESDGKTTLF
jgi:hypothetical protein